VTNDIEAILPIGETNEQVIAIPVAVIMPKSNWFK
jgi:hypothetical protein